MRRLLLLLLGALTFAAPASATSLIVGNAGEGQLVLQRLFDSRERPLWATARPFGGEFGERETLTTAYHEDEQAAVADDGSALVVWQDRAGDVVAAQRPAAGGFGAPMELGEARRAENPQLAMNGRGDAIVAWSRSGRPMQYVFRPAGGSFSAPADLPGAGVTPHVAVDADGGAFAAWRDANGAFHASYRPAGGAFGPATEVAHLREMSRHASFATASNGRMLIAWAQNGTIRTAERAPGSTTFGAVADVASGGVAFDAGVDALAVAPGGSAIIVWRADAFWAVTRDGTGAWSGAQFVGRSADSPLASFPDAAIDDSGRAPVVWDLEEFDQRTPVGIFKPEGGPFRGEPFTLAPPRPVAPGPAAEPSVALAASGRATVTWEQSDGEHASILAREFDASGLGPETVVLGRARTYVRERPASACRPRGARVLERSPRARLFVLRGKRYGCLLARGKRLSLPSRYAFPPVDLAGPLVAFAPDECTPNCRGRVAVMDLRDEKTGINRKVPAGGEVWSVVARVNGALAWISCPAEGRRRYGRLRQCIRERRVFALDSDGVTRRLLDESHAIDRRSLELRGDRLTWRRGGVRRHARLR